MLPGSSAELYHEDQIKLFLDPISKWSHAKFI